MKIYNYDENLFYIGESLADESPLEKGIFLIPAYATTIKPPKYKEGFNIKFNIELDTFEYVEIVDELKEKSIEVQTEEDILPYVISPLQFKLQLLEMNLVKDVETILATDMKAKIYYENVQTVEKSSPVLLDIASKLGMSQTDIDDFFIKAKAIVA